MTAESYDGTQSAPTTQVLRAEIKALKEMIGTGFAQVNKRLDDHAADNKGLIDKVQHLEVITAQDSARELPAKLAKLENEVNELKQWRWKMVGAASAISSVASFVVSHLLKA